MNKGMVYCRECGKWFFNKKKLNLHLIIKHGYEISLEEK